jgi:hypothetical protein
MQVCSHGSGQNSASETLYQLIIFNVRYFVTLIKINRFSSIQWVPGALSLGVKRPGREADHSPPSSAEVKE